MELLLRWHVAVQSRSVSFRVPLVGRRLGWPHCQWIGTARLLTLGFCEAPLLICRASASAAAANCAAVIYPAVPNVRRSFTPDRAPAAARASASEQNASNQLREVLERSAIQATHPIHQG